MAETTDALKILHRVTGDDERLWAGIAEARLHFEVARMVYDARTRAGLSQSELAKLIGRKPSVIERLEDGDYERLSLQMLRRIAEALGQRLAVRFVPRKTTLS